MSQLGSLKFEIHMLPRENDEEEIPSPKKYEIMRGKKNRLYIETTVVVQLSDSFSLLTLSHIIYIYTIQNVRDSFEK